MSDASAATDPRVVELLRESAAWRMIALLFECPSAAWREQIAALAAEVDDPQLRAAAEAALREATEGLYHTVFGPGGPAAPREVSYRRTVDAGAFLADLEAFYTAFAYTAQTPEPPDHVAVEAGFVAYLRFKEAYAVSRGDRPQAEVAADAAKHFLEDHLSLLADPLARALGASEIAYLATASAALARRVRR